MCVAYWPYLKVFQRMTSHEKSLSFILTNISLYFAYLPLRLEVLANFENMSNHNIFLFLNMFSVSRPIFDLVFDVFARLKHAFNRIIGML